MTANTFYLVQHGRAVDKQENPERPLSIAGKQETQTIAEYLKKLRLPVSAVFHSGKLRAQQTAEIFAAAFSVETSTLPGLAPNDPVGSLIPRLNIENALYIGHLPQLQKLTDYLLAGSEEAGIIHFQNSAVICLKQQAQAKTGHPSNTLAVHYQLAWYLPPTLLTPST
ncbi:MAG TPA: phosphohistidine phosphatase SixA [Gammaproteobacteria bacterium]|nr:phosphohistidine phosphatase SixA [Gammaproteobacteria bacterium]